jgi:Family of unknown function (DUF7010)
MDPSLGAEFVVGSSRGALIVAMFAGVWLYWGLSLANAFTVPRGVAVGVVEIVLLGGGMYFIRTGRALRRRYPPLSKSARRSVSKWFWMVVIAEVVLILIAVNAAAALHRPELIPESIAIVVGLHFLPLAKVFHAPPMAYIGSAIVVWCIVCWILFRGDALGAAAALGTGALLWISCASALLRARETARSLSAASIPAAPGR